jgi:hypothetical protein
MRFILRLLLILSLCAGTRPAFAEDWDPNLKWATPLPDGSWQMSHLLTAVSGKPNSEQTDSLLIGVKSIVREQNTFRLIRSDGADLVVPRDSHMGDRMFSCMEKIETQARDKLGNALADYVHNMDALVIDGDGVELRHSGQQEISVPLVTNQPWLPVTLKEIKLSNIRLQLVEGERNQCHRLKKISGIAAVVRVAGADLNVEPREFWRYKDKKGHTHVVLGIKSLIPSPVRSVFHLPEVVHVQYTFKKHKEKAEEPAPANSSESKVQ